VTSPEFPERLSDATLPIPEVGDDPPDPAGDLRALAAVARRRAQTMRELQARAVAEGCARDAASLALAAALFERDADARDRQAAALERPLPRLVPAPTCSVSPPRWSRSASRCSTSATRSARW
jgi:hypothetical protein